ncbi:hypothetical protein C2869_04890 [Saccharobesus litoralis]|uniref:Uncharacterized protein n=1 Tax=Saccharobesus litoralis TaxID=2172099 RepID=A0A2S0VNN7_9ALTE|nr:hypothetical protein [Saccharobesus litoralis]AWB65816.1 hypothetical protein C2869_04890 [Saccharobesus litoralis]
MQIGSASSNPVGGPDTSSAELRSAKLAKDQQEAEGQASLELLKSADVPPSQPADPAIGNNINIKV